MQLMLLSVTRRNDFSVLGLFPRRTICLGDAMNSYNDASESIREINLSYVMLAQRLLREDRPVGMFRLGLSAEVADILTNLSMAQIVKLAGADHLLCSFRFNDQAMLGALTKSQDKTQIAPTHAAVLMAGQKAVQFA